MREFISIFSIDNGVCSSVVKEIKIEFDCMMLGEWFGVPEVGFDCIMLVLRSFFRDQTKKTVLKYL